MTQEQTTILETEKLVLREFNPAIYQRIMTTQTDEEIKEYFGFVNNDELNKEKDRFKKGLTTFNRSFLWFYIIEKQTYKLIGWCGFHTWYLTHNRAEVGYMLNTDEHKGKGYMTEALAKVIDYGFHTMNLHRIEAMVGPENVPSLKLMKNFGFIQEGMLREHYFKNGKMEDSLVFGLLKKDYKFNDKT